MSNGTVIDLDDQFIQEATEIFTEFEKLCQGRRGVTERLYTYMAVPDIECALNCMSAYVDMIGTMNLQRIHQRYPEKSGDEIRVLLGEELVFYLSLVVVRQKLTELADRYGVRATNGYVAYTYHYTGIWPWSEAIML